MCLCDLTDDVYFVRPLLLCALCSNFGLLGIMDRLHKTDVAFRDFVRIRNEQPPFEYPDDLFVRALARRGDSELIS